MLLGDYKYVVGNIQISYWETTNMLLGNYNYFVGKLLICCWEATNMLFENTTWSTIGIGARAQSKSLSSSKIHNKEPFSLIS